MYEDHSGALWAGSGYQGISRLKNNKLTNWKNTGYLKDNNCEALYPAPAGNLFACTENGVTLLDPKLNDPAIAHFAFQKKYARPPELFGCFQMENSVYISTTSSGIKKGIYGLPHLARAFYNAALKMKNWYCINNTTATTDYHQTMHLLYWPIKMIISGVGII